MNEERVKEIIGKCSRCGNNVYESKVNFYCSNMDCRFALFKDDKYFASMRKKLTKRTAKSMLKDGRAKVTGLYSKKKERNFDAIIVLDATGEYNHFSMEFEPYEKNESNTNTQFI